MRSTTIEKSIDRMYDFWASLKKIRASIDNFRECLDVLSDQQLDDAWIRFFGETSMYIEFIIQDFKK